MSEESNDGKAVDVLIVGAGPAGLMCALGLARAGINVRIIDNRAKKVAAGQADGIQPRTIEVFQSYGLAERLLREGNQMHMASFYNPGKDGGIERTSRAPDVTAANARYPFEITLHQGAIEAIFLDALREMNVEVDRPTQPTHIELSDDEEVLKDPKSYAVKVFLRRLDTDTTELVRAKYVVGADGAHSWVRKTLGIVMEGEQTDYVWGVVDMVPETDFPDIRNKCAIHSLNGSCMIIPREGDLIRLYLQVTDTDAVTGGRVDKNKINPEKLLAVAQKSFYPYRISPSSEGIDWWTIYIIGQRVASKYSVQNRVFIAGDACHTHSPKAGQGMNASMNDSYNLLWKLAYVIRGWAYPAILNTYEYERRKYAQELIDFDRKFSALFSGEPFSVNNQGGVTHEEFLQAFQTFGGFTSGIGVKYSESSIVDSRYQSLASGLVVGMRIPPQIVIRAADAWPFNIHDLLPSDAKFKVIIFAGDVKSDRQKSRLRSLAAELGKQTSFLHHHCTSGSTRRLFNLITICIGRKEDINFTDIPAFFRPHWSKVYVDDYNTQNTDGGRIYLSYGVSADGLITIVRPDGYVGMIAPFDDIPFIEHYFREILSPGL